MTLRVLGNVVEFKGYPVALVLHSAPPSIQEEFLQWLRKQRLTDELPNLTPTIHKVNQHG